MLIRRLVALLTVLTLAGCGGNTVAPEAPAAPAESAPASESASASPSPSATPSAKPSATPKSSPKPTATKAKADPHAAAKAFIAEQPGTIGIVVKDRVAGTVWRAGNTTALNWTASTIKLALATGILQSGKSLTSTDRKNLRLSLVNSDNDATTALWQKFDGAAMLGRFQGTYGMKTLSVVPGYDVFWRNLRCSAEDLAALMSYVLDKLDAANRKYLVDTLRGVASFQHWGVWGAGSAQRPGNKDGWAQKPDGGVTRWFTHSVGFAGPNERYVVAVMYKLPRSGTLPQGAHAVSDLVATVFGAKVPAPISYP